MHSQYESVSPLAGTPTPAGGDVLTAEATVARVTRVSRTTAECKQSYDRMARFYDLMTASSEAEFTDRGVAALDAQPGESVCEIGCGTGRALEQIARKVGAGGTVVGFDSSTKMVETTRKRLESAKGINCRVAVVEGDAQVLCRDALRWSMDDMVATMSDQRHDDAEGDDAAPSQPTLDIEKDPLVCLVDYAPFDAVFMSFVLELVDSPNIPRLLRGIGHHLLRPGGRLVVVCLSRHVERTSVQLYEWFHRKMPSIVDCRPIHAIETISATSGFVVQNDELRTMWGLPVEIVVARWDPVGARGGHTSSKQRPTGSATFFGTASPVGIPKSQSNNSVPESMDTLQVAPQSTTSHEANVSFGATPTTPLDDSAVPKTGMMRRTLSRALILSSTPRCLWQNDAEADTCHQCSKPFRFFRRRHHCRSCGTVVCDNCSQLRVFIAGFEGRVRVCAMCAWPHRNVHH